MKIFACSSKGILSSFFVVTILLTFVLQIFPQIAANTQIKNIASVTFSDGATSYTNTSNEVIVTVAKISGLTITPDAQVDAVVVPGQTGIVKTFRVTNTGNFTDDVVFKANGASLRLIGEATITSATVGSDAVDILNNASAVTQSITQNGYVDVTVTLSVNAGATLGSTVQIFLGDATTGINFDNVAANNSANEVNTVSTGATNGSREARGDISFSVNAVDLTISKTHTGNFTSGSTGTYTITSTNIGNISTTETITVTDTLPTGLSVADGVVTLGGTNSGDWSCNALSNVITCTSAALIAPSGTSVFSFNVIVASNAPASVTNTASISGGGEPPSKTTNNTTTDPTNINNFSISGKVFEDYNYGGGAGRNFTTSGGSARQNARVELYNSSGNFVTSILTDASGNYTFSGLAIGNYTVRVVNSTVTSSRSGAVPSLIAVQTFRTDASSGTATDVTNYVGGENPCSVDAVTNTTSATLASLTSGTISGVTNGTCVGQPVNVPQSITNVTISSANVTGVDFGYNFDTIVNPKNSGQGSLRQFIANANALSNTGLNQIGLTAGRDTSIFMIPNGSSSAGLRSSLNYFSGGAATIPIATSLPTVNDTVTLDGTTQPGFNSAPIIEVTGANMPVGANNHILILTASNNVIRKLVLNRAGDDAIYAPNGSNSNLFVGNYIGVNVAGTAIAGNAADGIDVEGNNNTIGGLTAAERNLIGGAGNGHSGIEIGGGATPSSGTVVIGNYLGTNSSDANLANGAAGIEVRSTSGTTTIGGSATGAPNVIARNAEVGVTLYANTTSGVFISQNSIYANGSLGIDLSWDDVTLNDANDADTGSNSKLNFPVVESVTASAGNVTIVGCSPTGATIELFKTDIAMGTASVGDNKAGKLQDYGEGQSYLMTLTEGSGSDNDSGTGCSTDVDGNNQTGMSRFSFTFAVPSGVSTGTMLTSTATVSGIGTSEFSPIFTLVNGIPSVALLKSCPSPANCTTTPQLPETDLTYNIQFTNTGGAGAANFTLIDKIPDFTDYKIGSAVANVGTSGLVFAIEYSSDYDPLNPTAATWGYTPVSGGGGASVGYDRLVKAVRWRVTSGIMSNISPNNTGSVSFIAKIR